MNTTLRDGEIRPQPTPEEQAAFLEANKDASHFVWVHAPAGHFPCVAVHMVSKATGVLSLPFRFVCIDPSFEHFVQTLTYAGPIMDE